MLLVTEHLLFFIAAIRVRDDHWKMIVDDNVEKVWTPTKMYLKYGWRTTKWYLKREETKQNTLKWLRIIGSPITIIVTLLALPFFFLVSLAFSGFRTTSIWYRSKDPMYHVWVGRKIKLYYSKAKTKWSERRQSEQPSTFSRFSSYVGSMTFHLWDKLSHPSLLQSQFSAMKTSLESSQEEPQRAKAIWTSAVEPFKTNIHLRKFNKKKEHGEVTEETRVEEGIEEKIDEKAEIKETV